MRPISMPSDKAARKGIPMTTGLLDYFPDALMAVAALSVAGNKQHNPGEPLHWARGKSADQADTIVRHLMERGTFDDDGHRHSTKVAWRALAQLQLEIEAAVEAGEPAWFDDWDGDADLWFLEDKAEEDNTELASDDGPLPESVVDAVYLADGANLTGPFSANTYPGKIIRTNAPGVIPG